MLVQLMAMCPLVVTVPAGPSYAGAGCRCACSRTFSVSDVSFLDSRKQLRGCAIFCV